MRGLLPWVSYLSVLSSEMARAASLGGGYRTAVICQNSPLLLKNLQRRDSLSQSCCLNSLALSVLCSMTSSSHLLYAQFQHTQTLVAGNFRDEQNIFLLCLL